MLYFNSGRVELGRSSAVVLSICIVSLSLLKQSPFQRVLTYFQQAIIRSAVLVDALESIREAGRGPWRLPSQVQHWSRASPVVGLSLKVSWPGTSSGCVPASPRERVGERIFVGVILNCVLLFRL